MHLAPSGYWEKRNNTTQPTHESTTTEAKTAPPPPRPFLTQRNAWNQREEHATNMMSNIIHDV
jgi:hypothetical protein